MSDQGTGTSPSTSPLPARAGRALRIALAISVALNLAIAGLVGGAIWRFRSNPPPAVRELGFGPFTEALTPDQRAELRRGFVDRSAGFRSMRRAVREDTTRMLTILRTDPFDADAFSAQLSQINTRFATRMSGAETALRSLVLSMQPDERLAFAARLEDALRRDLRDPPPRPAGP